MHEVFLVVNTRLVSWDSQLPISWQSLQFNFHKGAFNLEGNKEHDFLWNLWLHKL